MTMDHRAYKTLHMPLEVPDGFTIEQVGDNPATPANPRDYTGVMIPLTMEQYKFITTAATSQPGEIQKIPGDMRSPTLECFTASWIASATSAG